MILASGCFDGLHAGHVGYLHAAAALDPSQELVVAVASALYILGAKGHPAQYSPEDRMAVVMALGKVDRVVMHGKRGAAEVIQELRPSIFVKGVDWKGQIPEDIQAACQAVGCQIRFVNSGSSVHTSDARSTLAV